MSRLPSVIRLNPRQARSPLAETPIFRIVLQSVKAYTLDIFEVSAILNIRTPEGVWAVTPLPNGLP